MKNGKHWGGVVIVIAGLFLTLYLFRVSLPASLFPWGVGYRSFGPRMWPVHPFIAVPVLIVLGLILVRLLFPTSRRASSPPNDGWTFCPHCGGDLRQVGKTDIKKGEPNVSLPRT